MHDQNVLQKREITQDSSPCGPFVSETSCALIRVQIVPDFNIVPTFLAQF